MVPVITPEALDGDLVPAEALDAPLAQVAVAIGLAPPDGLGPLCAPGDEPQPAKIRLATTVPTAGLMLWTRAATAATVISSGQTRTRANCYWTGSTPESCALSGSRKSLLSRGVERVDPQGSLVVPAGLCGPAEVGLAVAELNVEAGFGLAKLSRVVQLVDPLS